MLMGAQPQMMTTVAAKSQMRLFQVIYNPR
jgi:hypothetical protein